MPAPHTFRALVTLLAAGLAALVWRHFHWPLPWMIGPLLVTAVASMLGAPTVSWTPLRNAAQWIIGATLGLYFTQEVMALLVRLWWAVLLAIAWSLCLGGMFSRWLDGVLADHLASARERQATSFFAGAIGGASEMTLLAERAGGRTDLVAAAHSLRMLVVTVSIPTAFQFSGLHGLDPTAPVARLVSPTGLALLGLATLAAAMALARTRWPNPWFLGPFAVATALTLAQVELSALPIALPNAAQLAIGVSLGVRFRAEFVHTAPRWLGAVALGTVLMIAASAAFAWALGRMTGLEWATLVLGTAPGGIAEMAITAKVLALGVPVVTAFQVCRLVTVLVLLEPLYRRLRVAR